MHPIILAIVIISALGVLFGIRTMIYSLISSFKVNVRKILYSKATLFTVLTILSYFLAVTYKNFFYGFPAVPLLIAASTVLFISRKMTIASVNRKSRWISILLAMLWGIWSFCIYAILQTKIMPDYVTLNQLREHGHLAYGISLVLIIVFVMIISIIINLEVAINGTSSSPKQG